MRAIKIFGYLLLLLIGRNIVAIEYSYSIFSTLGHNDNFNSNLEEPSGYSLNTGIAFLVNSDENIEWGLDLSGNYSKEIFNIDELPDQDVKVLAFELTYDASNSNFSFLLRDDISQRPRDRMSTQQVQNLMDVNTITVRPTYFFNLTSLDRLFFEATFIDTTVHSQSELIFDLSSTNTENLVKSIRYERTLNRTNEIALIFNSIDTDFEGNVGINGIDYTQEDTSLRWVRRGQLNQLQLEYGISKIEDTVGREYDMDLINIIFDRQINRTHQIEMNYQEGFYIPINNNAIDGSVDISNDSFGVAQESSFTNLEYNISETYFSFAMNVFNREFHGLGIGYEETRKGIGFTASYSLARIFSTSLNTNISLSVDRYKGFFMRQNGLEINTRVDDAELRFNYSYSPELSYFVALSVRDTASDNSIGYLNGGDSNMINIGFIYTPRMIGLN